MKSGNPFTFARTFTRLGFVNRAEGLERLTSSVTADTNGLLWRHAA